jgi:hypothetical protein
MVIIDWRYTISHQQLESFIALLVGCCLLLLLVVLAYWLIICMN